MNKHSNKESFCQQVVYPNNMRELSGILKSKFLFTYNIEDYSDLRREILTNMWCIGLTKTFAKNTSVKLILNFFEKFWVTLQERIDKDSIKPPITFYMWYDEQALQLRFNLISTCTKKLPFGCKLHFLNKANPIIEKFLNSDSDVKIQDEFKVDDYEDNNEDEYILPIFSKCFM